MNAIEAAARIAECFDEDVIAHSLAAAFAHSEQKLVVGTYSGCSVAHFLTFLMSSQSGGILEHTLSTSPSPRRPEDLFQWKITSGTNGEVSVRGFHTGPPQLLGTAVWKDGKLTGFHQEQVQVPSDRKWIAIEETLVRELSKRTERGDPDDVNLNDDITRGERRRLYDRVATNWQRMGPRYDHKGVDRYFMRRVAWVMGVGFVVLVAAIVIPMLVMTRSSSRSSSSNSRPTMRSTPSQSSQSTTTHAPSIEERVAAADTFAAAVALAKSDPTGIALAHHANARWSDVSAPAETTIGHVQKDADAEYGKRMCAEGTIDRIERRDVGGHKRFVGKVVRSDGDVVEFVALGTTGELIRKSNATFCGVVVGKTGDAPVLVGLFDLPENRTPIVEQ